ncbi:unnamed protein product [Ciceribacter selenitireducens ATCC BAA-1503]|uniref:Uncharacterized protein n=1 Tax=Ciceribacter selenitireducens ATCC BAA-1503 TaxID=1336235 RepID=A0A376AI20_9HYPH|nr:unnamed protein product [Ciceribacter selenitireducens ATCC BAA-1503]
MALLAFGRHCSLRCRSRSAHGRVAPMCSICGQIRWPSHMSIPLIQHGFHRHVGLPIPFILGR